ncbi:MAG: LicD family protein [Defluviitaleaceae bacterium]|nr:LicD family protein [Defluviitaleaceae bacterium]MCL2273914.1 LicD family protein [Defluviitaleaceae bacterium]
MIEQNKAYHGDILYDNLLVVPMDFSMKRHEANVLYIIHAEDAVEIKDALCAMGIDACHICIIICRTHAVQKAYQTFNKELQFLKKMSLREIQNTLFNLLVVFRNFCNAHQLRYFLGGGTLIGAARHKGFIPWDDDVDVFMPYEDYLRFIDIYPRNERYEVIHWRTGYNDAFDIAGFADNETTLLDGRFLSVRKKPLTMCIIPLNGAPKEPIAFEKYITKKAALDFMWYKHMNERDLLGDAVPDMREDIEQAKRDMPYEGSEVVVQLHDFVKEPFFKLKSIIFNEVREKFVKQRFLYKKYVSKEYFKDSIQMEFEGELFSVPVMWHEYLMQIYLLDYRMLPPEERRYTHDRMCYFN